MWQVPVSQLLPGQFPWSWRLWLSPALRELCRKVKYVLCSKIKNELLPLAKRTIHFYQAKTRVSVSYANQRPSTKYKTSRFAIYVPSTNELQNKPILPTSLGDSSTLFTKEYLFTRSYAINLNLYSAIIKCENLLLFTKVSLVPFPKPMTAYANPGALPNYFATPPKLLIILHSRSVIIFQDLQLLKSMRVSATWRRPAPTLITNPVFVIHISPPMNYKNPSMHPIPGNIFWP